MTALRLLHWNLHSWTDPHGASNVDAVEQLLRAEQPDLVSLVEVDEIWGAPQLEQLADRLGMAWAFAPALEYGTDDSEGGFGNAVLTRLPLVSVQSRQLTWPTSVYDGHEASEPRTLLLIKVSAEAGPLWFGSTHLPRGDAEARDRALSCLTTIAISLTDPWIICGDCNTPASTWLEPNLVAVPVGQPTAPDRDPTECIDYVVTTAGRQISAEALATAGSDHLPVVAELRLDEDARE